MIMNGGMATATSSIPMNLVSGSNFATSNNSPIQMTGLQFGGTAASSTAQQVRLVQLVLDASKVRNANANANTPVVANSGAISDDVDGAAESDTTCTLCGRKCSDRQNFNAHIRMHLKEKLNIRREQKQQKQQQQQDEEAAKTTSDLEISASSSSSASPAPLNVISVKNIPVILPSSPLPLSTVVKTVSSSPLVVTSQIREKPDLESLLSQLSPKLLAAHNHNRVMAQLAGCQPIPLDSCQNVVARPTTNVTRPTTSVTRASLMPLTIATSSSTYLCSPPKSEPMEMNSPAPSIVVDKPFITEPLATPDISDMEEDLMSYEMDFHNDISSILDQLEKDFENSSSGLNDVRLDTPPDSDSENSDYLNQLLDEGLQSDHEAPVTVTSNILTKIKIEDEVEAPSAAAGYDLLAASRREIFVNPQLPTKTTTYVLPSLKRPASQSIDNLLSDVLLQRRTNNNNNNSNASTRCVVQSAESVARVGQLPVETLSILNKLPSKIFLPNGRGSDRDSPRVIDVVKVERSNSTAVGHHPSVGQPFAIINIECHQAGNAGQGLGKLIETYRAIDTGSEIKLLLGNGSPLNDVILDKATWSVRSTIGQPQQQQQTTQQPQPISVPPPTLSKISQLPSPVQQPQQQLSTVQAPKVSHTIPKSKMSSECSVCGKSITTKNMARHMEKHTGKKKFECNFCSATFSQKMHLKNHVILHVTKVDPSVQQQQQNQKTVSAPEKSTALTTTSATMASTSTPSHPNKTYACPTCKRSFVQKGHLNRHIRTAHGGGVISRASASSTTAATSAEQLTCRVCQKQCKNKVSLMRHRTKHLACVQCSSIFQNKVALQDHLLKVHPDSAIVSVERPFPQPSPTPLEDPSCADDFLDPVMSGVKSPVSTFDRVIKVDVDEMSSVVGETLADIADTNFFDSARDLSDEFYPTDLF